VAPPYPPRGREEEEEKKEKEVEGTLSIT